MPRLTFRPMIRALVFDFDGLILDTESPLIDAWVQVHRRAGLVCLREEALEMIGHVDIAYDPWSAFPPETDRAALERDYREIKNTLLQDKAVLPGVRERLAEARSLGLKMAVASNSSHPWVDAHLERLGLLDFFSTTRCRDDVARGKPAPDVYHAVLAVLGVRADETIAFEDSGPGSLAAKRAGLWCVAVPSACTHRHDFSHVDLRIDSLASHTIAELAARFDRCARTPSQRSETEPCLRP